MKYHPSRDPYGDRQQFSRYGRTNPLLDLYRAYVPLWFDYVLIPMALVGLATLGYFHGHS